MGADWGWARRSASRWASRLEHRSASRRVRRASLVAGLHETDEARGTAAKRRPVRVAVGEVSAGDRMDPREERLAAADQNMLRAEATAGSLEWEKLGALELASCAFKEALRLWGPSTMLPRMRGSPLNARSSSCSRRRRRWISSRSEAISESYITNQIPDQANSFPLGNLPPSVVRDIIQL